MGAETKRNISVFHTLDSALDSSRRSVSQGAAQKTARKKKKKWKKARRFSFIFSRAVFCAAP